MADSPITLNPIGVIHTPFQSTAGTPIQPHFAQEAAGTVEVYPPYADGLLDLDGFERIWLIYAFDRSQGWKPRVVPFRDVHERGVFATRAPARPNPLGISCVRLAGVEGRVLQVLDVDMLDGTPLLDIKPYSPQFDAYPGTRAGWLDARRTDRRQADDRFG